MIKLHPKIEALRNRTAGEYLTCRYVDAKGVPSATDYKTIADKDNRMIEGYLAVFGVRDSYGTVAMKGCFAESINDRGPKSNAKNKIIHLWMHDPYEPVGSYVELFEDDYGLRFKLAVDDVSGRPEQVLKQTRSGTINQYSYGFHYVWDKMEFDETKDAVLMYEVDLFEGTSVSIGAANPEASTIRNREDLIARLQELGNEAEDIIQTLPRKNQIEIRQLITRYKTLAEIKPIEKRSLDLSGEPSPSSIMVVGEYKLDVNQFKQ